ncbi:DUF1604-domain-containing protein [Testicularia cyperi]|uniref:DUF1604-domain-containing protein n=1 Tax=Testicularia cyperi TaxID=1882483 RepID=A0A317XS67_9BASI|nr:DUF1604-domain-containing protein [Testicularia cyperi]
MATDRLRRRLRDADDSANLSGLTENFCIVGTPLPAVDARKKDANELKPIWQQEARDEQGRRRFHGAFTGGFSAGYFNTVGSKEGWTPSSFRSSRADKAKGVQQDAARQNRPEDFMDEEDLQDWKSTQQVKIAAPFSSSSQIAKSSARDRDPLLQGLDGSKRSEAELVASTLLEQITPQIGDGIGFQMLRRMGWKDGQGLGARVDAEKRRRLLRLVYGHDTPDKENEGAILAEEKRHLFAPPDTKPLQPIARLSRHGLGWTRGPRLQELLSSAAPRSQRHATKDTKLLELGSRSGDATRAKWRDGSPMVSGFHLASDNDVASLGRDSCTPPSPVPEGWSPDPQRVFQLVYGAKSVFGTDASAPIQLEGSGHLDSVSRGKLLGEARIPGPPPNIAAFLSEKARERLANASSAQIPSSLARPVASENRSFVDVPPTDAATAKMALQGFMPFGNDLAKQSRYRAYLKSQVDPASELAQRQTLPMGVSRDQLTNELREFAKSAAVFRPMSSAMASRFTSASSSATAQDFASPNPGLWQPPPRTAASSDPTRGRMPAAATGPETSSREAADEQLSIAQQAARMGNFGPLTRKTEDWFPARLLCKRFGLPDPHPGKSTTKADVDEPSISRRLADDDEGDLFYGAARSGRAHRPEIKVDQHWKNNKAQLRALAAGPTPLSRSLTRTNSATTNPGDQSEAISEQGRTGTSETLNDDNDVEAWLSQVGVGDDERQGHDTLTYVKPAPDVYRAVFGADSDDEDDGSGDAHADQKVSGPGPRPKMQDPTAAFNVTFTARSKRKDAAAWVGLDHSPANSSQVAEAGTGEKKRKREKKSTAPSKGKGMLTFDMDDGEPWQTKQAEAEAEAEAGAASHTKKGWETMETRSY